MLLLVDSVRFVGSLFLYVGLVEERKRTELGTVHFSLEILRKKNPAAFQIGCQGSQSNRCHLDERFSHIANTMESQCAYLAFYFHALLYKKYKKGSVTLLVR